MVERGRGSDVYVGIPYLRTMTPHVLLDPAFDREKGPINCQTFVHLYYKSEFGVNLPAGMWSKEMFEDLGEFFRPVNNDEEYVKGDVFFWGVENTDVIDLHVAVLHQTGMTPDEIVFRHANKKDEMVSDWTMREMMNFEKYQILYGVRRLIPDYFDPHVAPFVNARRRNYA